MPPNFKEKQAIMKELLDNGELLNTTILTEDGGAFRIHIEFLAGFSPYLNRVFIAAKKTPFESVLIQGIPKEVMASIISFIYTGVLELSMDMVSDMAKAGKILEISQIVDFCREHIMQNLNNENCLKIFTSPDYCTIPEIRDKIKPYILRHFQQIFPVSSDYLSLDVNELKSLLSKDELNVNGEDYIFWAIIRWADHDPETRKGELPNLLRCIRFGLCSPQFFNHTIQEHPYIKNNAACQDIILQVSEMFADMEPSMGDQRNNMLLDVRHLFLRPRIPSEIIFVMGGWSSGSATNVIETFDVKSKRWFLSLATDNIPRAYHGMLWHKGYIYILGGFDGQQCFSDMKRFNPETYVWEEKGCMYQQRCYVSVAAVDNYIYAMGGYDGHRRNKSCERYDPDTNQWKMMANMMEVRSDASADTLNGKIYIAGGFNGQAVLNTAECYDPESDTWTNITNLSSPRSGLRVKAYNDCLYLIGGFNGNMRLNTVEKYDTRTRQWTAVPNMNTPRSNFATELLYDCLYVMGGFNGLATVPFTECYDYRKNVWVPTTDLNLNRSALAACTVKDIQNASAYCFLGNTTRQVDYQETNY